MTYRHCVWPVRERFHLKNCVAFPVQTTSSWRGGIFQALLVALIGLLLLVFLIWLGLKKKQPILLYLLVVAVLIGIIVAFYVGRNRSSSAILAKSVPGLESGTAYYWKVIAEDGKGGTTESETRRFEIK